MDIQTVNQESRIASQDNDKKIEKAEEPTAVTAKKQFNAAILQSAVDNRISAGNDPQALVLKAALDGINEALQENLGDNAIQTAYDSGIDISPEATAGRIVSLSTAFYTQFREQNPELHDKEALSSFVEIISGGIDTGFAEARDILDGLAVLEGEIAENIDRTYELVQQGLESFVENFTFD
jgi:Domain of unknown function (DUF5610)